MEIRGRAGSYLYYRLIICRRWWERSEDNGIRSLGYYSSGSLGPNAPFGGRYRTRPATKAHIRFNCRTSSLHFSAGAGKLSGDHIPTWAGPIDVLRSVDRYHDTVGRLYSREPGTRIQGQANSRVA